MSSYKMMGFLFSMLVLVFVLGVFAVKEEGGEKRELIEQCEQSIPRDQSCKLIAVVDDTFNSK